MYAILCTQCDIYDLERFYILNEDGRGRVRDREIVDEYKNQRIVNYKLIG